MRSTAIAELLEAGERAATRDALHSALTTLHESGDARELCALHRLAATYWQDDTERAAFHRTHAYIYALEAGDDAATRDLYAVLEAQGRI